jgi:uncharacterized protein (DUF1501 family)
MRIQRRNFMKSLVAWGGFGTTSLSFLGRQKAFASAGAGNKRLLFIFQRGGNDGLNTIVPHGDNLYLPSRANIGISLADMTAAGTNLGNNFAGLHPQMAPMMSAFTPGELAVIHRVGYAQQSRSHFDSQDYWEKGDPRGNQGVTDGMLYRQLAHMLDLSDPSVSFPAAGLSGSQMVTLTGYAPNPNFHDSKDFNFLGNADDRAKFLGQLPTAQGSGDGKGVLGMYADTPLATALYADLVKGTGQALGGTISTLTAANITPYLPNSEALYPGGSFGSKLKEAAMLFKRTDACVLGINIGGWDTHNNQGGAIGGHGNNLNSFASAFEALKDDLGAESNGNGGTIWDDTIVVSMTEFGRTSKENGSGGTDHAEASAMFVAGGSVNGGVYNCDDTTWETGANEADSAMFKVNNRYLSRRTDFRAVFGEIFMKHLGDTRADLDIVIPGYTEAEQLATTNGLPDMTQLGILS